MFQYLQSLISLEKLAAPVLNVTKTHVPRQPLLARANSTGSMEDWATAGLDFMGSLGDAVYQSMPSLSWLSAVLLICAVGVLLILFSCLISRLAQFAVDNLSRTIRLLVAVTSGALIFVFVMFAGLLLQIQFIVRSTLLISYIACIALGYTAGTFPLDVAWGEVSLRVQYGALPYALNYSRHLPMSYRPFVARVWSSVLAGSLVGKPIGDIERVLATLKAMHTRTAETGVTPRDTPLLLEAFQGCNVLSKADWGDMTNVRDTVCPRK